MGISTDYNIMGLSEYDPDIYFAVFLKVKLNSKWRSSLYIISYLGTDIASNDYLAYV